MLITASTNPFYSELVRGVERSCFERGYSLVLCNTEGDEQRMNRNLETLMQNASMDYSCCARRPISPPGNHAALSVGTDGYDGLGPFDGDSDLIQDNSLLGGDMATQYLIDQGIHALPVLPARWIKPRRACVLKAIMPRWRAAACRLPKDMW